MKLTAMRKIYIFFLTLILASGLSGCSDFLSETPNKSGSAYIYHMDQLYGMMGNPGLYRTGYAWTEQIFLGDAVEWSPYFTANFAPSANPYNVWTWSHQYLETGTPEACTWSPCWNSIYSFNTVFENMDAVVQTTPAVRKQVEGEALYGRAYYHFIALVQYSLWDENAPGIGYRVNTLPSDIPSRETVKYTLDRIYQDLDDAEAALTAAGRTQFEIKRNFRPTVPTVKALRARIDLYRGNYASALANANAALAAYDFLLDFKNDPRYTLVARPDKIKILDATNTTIVSELTTYHLEGIMQNSLVAEIAWKYEEFYMPHFSDLYFANREVPISEWYYNLFDHANDERWKRFYDHNYMVYFKIGKTMNIGGTNTPRCFTWEDQQGIKEANRHAYQRFVSANGSSGKYFILGLTTAEMYLIKAECLARAGQTAEAANVLKTLRRTRFTTTGAADAIGGSVQEVLDERAREMTELWRFFDIKRLNGAENANIRIQRTILTIPNDINTTQAINIAPDDPRWAIPVTKKEKTLMGWE